MTRLLLGAAIGFTVGIVGAAALNLHAQDLDGIPVGTIEAANEAGVSVHALLGWMASEPGVPARTLLLMSGELSAPVSEPSQADVAPVQPTGAASVLERRADCVIWRESRGYAGAVNPRSGASGLGQFLPSTWRTTPQGRAGYSVFDPVANRQAVIWMLTVGRGREFATIGGC